MRTSRTIWDLGELPFYAGPSRSLEERRLPARMPFKVGHDDDVGLITQVFEADTAALLQQVYAQGAQLGVRMDDRGLGKRYADDFVTTVGSWLDGNAGGGVDGDLRGRTILEVGCGSGHLLTVLADAGAEVEGVEPDPRCKAAMEERGIPVACCEFDDFEPSRTWDCVLHYGVLEHVVDPVAFLRRQRDLLAPEGCIVCAVPDCEPALAAGDMSILVHQHWSYFSAASLRGVAAAAGLRVQDEASARVGALLYACLVADRDDAAGAGPPDRADADAGDPSEVADTAAIGDTGERVGTTAPDALDFVDRARVGRRRVRALVRHARERGRALGIYCPERAINYVDEDDGAWRVVRLFDDADHLHDRYVPPFVSPVEGRDGLQRRGVDELLIMSRPFGDAIEKAVRGLELDPAPRVRHIGEVLAGA